MLLANLLEEPDVRSPRDPSFLGSGLCEALFAAGVMLPTLFVVQLGSKAPALSFALTLVWLAVRGRQALGGIARRWPLLLVPGFAVLSVVWSDYPSDTAKHAAELCLTVLGGLMLATSPAPAGAVAGVWGAFGLFMVVSFVLGKSIDMTSFTSGATDSAFAGLNGMKNLFGMQAAIAVLASMFMLARSVARKSLLFLLAAGALLLIELYLVWVARSAGAVIGLFIAAAAFTVTASMGPLRPTGRIIGCCMLALLALTVGVLAYAFADAVASGTMAVFHKDPTLTGRSYLWYRSNDFIHERPLLGRGFESFWVKGNTDAEGLWRYAGMDQRTAFNFHNTFIELLIHFGIVGTALTLLVFAFAFVQLFRRAILEPNTTSAFYIGFIIFELSRTPVESLMPQSFDFATVLMFGGLGYGFEKLSLRAAAYRAELQRIKRMAEVAIMSQTRQRPQPAREAWARRQSRGAGPQPLA